MEEGQKEPVSFTSDDSQSTSQEEIREGEQKNESLNMILDAWKDSFTFEDRRYSSSQQSLHDTIFVCSITTEIVGLGAMEFNEHELLELVRYPQSPYDKSAIKVFNSSSVEVGYLHIPVAKVLSPLVDLQKINLEGELTNSRNRYDSSMPCLVKIFSKSDDTQNVQDWILQNSLCFCDQPGPSFRAYEGMGVQEKNMIEKLGTLEPPKNVIKAKLLDHQKEGLWWLVSKEKSDELPPFWEVKDGLYLNLLTMHQTDRRPDPLHGGIFADDHGLGKTLTFLSLISFDKVGTLPEATGKRDMVKSVSSGKKRGGLVRGKGTGGQKTHTLLGNNTKESSLGMADESSSALVPKQTLIVCPSVVCSTWESQLQEHTHKGSLKLYKYYGNSRTKDVEELKKYDIVLTTYRTLTAECFRRMRCPLMKIEWWRVILDEAHVIKNANARQSRALDPLSIKRYWQGLLQRPLADGDENLLQVLMATISLRRIKDKLLIGLPSKTVETVSLQLSGEERELYDRMESSSKDFVDYFIFADRLRSRYSFVLFLVLRLRKLCDDSALCSLDLRSLLPSDNIRDASKHPELLGKMIDMLQDGEDFVCAICGCPPTDAVIMKCLHIFCKRCICYYLPRKEFEKGCPSCGDPISKSGLFSAPRESSNPENTKKTSRTTPSKVSALIELFKESSAVNSSSKSVVFSLFDKMLVLLEEPLKDAGFNTLRLDASTDERGQDEIIKGFGSAGPDTVLLASLRTSVFGINLTAASKVYLLEPWWNSADEEQAINCVHRYGQKENVRVVRLIAQNSIEERILEMQERKKLASEAFGRQGQKERREVSIDDLCSLFSFWT
ncbi:hypothetical protein POTOM_052378 [Populus tomentosa]|uniref:SWI/SNF-related matrix-associated actin-dependent regulator of chromatin subfamily A member 3-like 1 n=1 Tax=Populus tomentosa TaxID=118781 RepID=A0A8X8C778_POPTO|nr:hypothetical protein POTOM_052378 [Populus tomentosa]